MTTQLNGLFIRRQDTFSLFDFLSSVKKLCCFRGYFVGFAGKMTRKKTVSNEKRRSP